MRVLFLWAARHSRAVALYFMGPFRRQGDAPPLIKRSLLPHLLSPRPPSRGPLLHKCKSLRPTRSAQPRWGHDRCRCSFATKGYTEICQFNNPPNKLSMSKSS